MATIAPPGTCIADLDDQCRMGLDRRVRIVATRHSLATIAKGKKDIDMVIGQARLLKAACDVRFAPDDRPERDFGLEDLADASITTGVLTITLAQDY